MKRSIICLLTVSLILALLTGCASEQGAYVPTGGELIYGTDPVTPTAPTQEKQDIALVYYPDKSLNPYTATNHTNRVLLSLIYQGLFTVDRDYVARPILCQSYNITADMKTYTFYLANAMFSDGTAVTATDVIASLNAAKESQWYGGRLQHVTKISAYGNAVMVELDTPMENLPILLDVPIVKASQVNEARPVGSGPYRLDGETLKRQAAWWCNATLPVNADEIRLIAAGSAAQVRDAFEFSGVSLVCTDPAANDYVDFRSDYELFASENGQFLFLVSNAKSKVFSVPEIRAALTYAIDRSKLSEEFYHGFGLPASLPCSPESPWYDQSLAEEFDYEPEKFAAAVAAAELETREVTLLVNTSDVVRSRVGNAIADMLRAGGLQVTVTGVTATNFAEALKKGEYDLYLGQTRLSQNMDLTAFFATNGTMSYGGLTDPSLYALSLEALANAGNYYNLHRRAMEDGQLCPILFQSYGLYTQRGILPALQPARDTLFYYDLGRTIADAQAGT